MIKVAIVLLFVYVLADASAFKHSSKNVKLQEGLPAALGQFPFVVGLKPQLVEESRPICAGSIIDSRHVLTEAWCVQNLDNIEVIAGCIDWNDDCSTYQIESFTVHPDWQGMEGVNDVAVITLAEEIAFNDNIQSIALSANVIEAGVTTVQIGWTSDTEGPKDLRWMEVEVADQTACLEEWPRNDDTNMCTQPGGVPTWGDYGGPLIVDNEQVGIFVLEGDLDIHVRVESFLDFINSAVRI